MFCRFVSDLNRSSNYYSEENLKYKIMFTLFDQVSKKASPPGSPTQQQDIDKLKQQLSTKQAELEQVNLRTSV